MGNDPQRQEQLRRQRTLFILLMIPWFFMLYMFNKQQKALLEEQQRREVLSQTAIAPPDREAPLDERIEDLRRRIEADPRSQQADFYALEIAVAYEEAGFWDRAAAEFEKFSRERRGSPYAAHAAFHAARIARGKLNDEKRFKKLLNGLTYDINRCVWDPANMGDPGAKHIAGDISSEVLDEVNRHDVRYKVLDFLVGLFDPAAHPETAYAFGVMLLGLLVKIAIWPLTTWGYRASKTMGVKMKLVQPQIAELRERYKDEQMKLMQKQQELMRRYGISMRSGCLPAILQMAILIPVYQAVRLYSHPLHAGSFLWIGSLARPDLILLIIYTVMFILSMKLQPQQPSADRQQQQMQTMMMYVMPIMFFFMMRSVPSAFILYWTVFLVFSTGQTLWLSYRWRVMGGDEAVYATMPPELLPKPTRPKRKETGAPAIAAAASVESKRRGDRPTVSEPIVERLGEEIVPSDGATPRGFFARLFAPALQGGGRDGDGQTEPSEDDTADATEEEPAQVLDRADAAGQAITPEERRRARKERRRSARRARADSSQASASTSEP